ncbi:MAG: carbon storage regulator CsrA [Lachnospiraceae bacterium]
MLILRRKKNESILIGEDIRITILECAGDGVRIAIDAPKQISIIREELSAAEETNKMALAPKTSAIQSLQAALAKQRPAES